MMSRMHERYRKEVVPALMKRFGKTNPMAVPKVAKVIVNIGMGEASQNVKLLDVAVIELGQITGQKPVDHPRQEVDREFQDSQGHADRLLRDAARRPHVRISGPAVQRRAAARARLPGVAAQRV